MVRIPLNSRTEDMLILAIREATEYVERLALGCVYARRVHRRCAPISLVLPCDILPSKCNLFSAWLAWCMRI